jgi:hypothetical protein
MVEIDFLIIAVVLNANKSDRHKNGFFQRKKTFIDLPLLEALQLQTIESYQPIKLKHFVSILKPNQYYSLYLTKDKNKSWSELILDINYLLIRMKYSFRWTHNQLIGSVCITILMINSVAYMSKRKRHMISNEKKRHRIRSIGLV